MPRDAARNARSPPPSATIQAAKPARRASGVAAFVASVSIAPLLAARSAAGCWPSMAASRPIVAVSLAASRLPIASSRAAVVATLRISASPAIAARIASAEALGRPRIASHTASVRSIFNRSSAGARRSMNVTAAGDSGCFAFRALRTWATHCTFPWA